MASSPPTDGADHVVTWSSPRTSISNEKAGIAVVTETDVSSDAKTSVKVEVSQVCDIPSTSRMQSYMQSFHDLFTVETFWRYGAVLVKFGKFTGPGTIISVAYIDPDNYQTAVSSGAEFKFKLLFMILVSNLIAIYLQALAVKLGVVTGLDLAQMNRAYLPRWLNIGLWVMAEAAIVCTDIGQVIGTAIAINILIPKIPLVGGCLLSATDTLIILFFYKPDGSLRGLRAFELFVSIFVLGVFISFCIELSLITSPIGEVFDGFLPSRDVFVGQGSVFPTALFIYFLLRPSLKIYCRLYQSCAILGGTLMPHTLYLGSGLVQARMRDFDRQNDKLHEARASTSSYATLLYRPTLSAIKFCLSYSIAELCVTLFIIAIFVNSAILIVAAASLSEAADNADLYGMYRLFVSTISQASGTLFALGLLFSGVSAGIVATMAGQLVCEGAMNWRISPFLRRLVTRSVAIIPGIIIAGIKGRNGLAAALNGCNVVLSLALIFLTFPLVWYTARDRYMRVKLDDSEEPVGVIDGIFNYQTERAAAEAGQATVGTISLANNLATTVVAWLIWLFIAGMNVATLVFLGMGIGDN